MGFHFWRLAWVGALMLGMVCEQGLASDQPVDQALGEQVFFATSKSDLFPTSLETTLFKPPGEGPFPLIVINHGLSKAILPGAHPRYRPIPAAYEFVRRGFVVAAPMRKGFSRSGGSYFSNGCDIERNGLDQAESVKIALDYLTQLPYVDKHRIIIAGQSHGGLATLAFAQQVYPGVLGLLNFAGGLRKDSCSGWEDALTTAFAHYGGMAQYTSLWFYGSNDTFWSPELIRRMADGYNASSGGKARVVQFGAFGKDSHSLFSSGQGTQIWVPEVARYFAGLGLDFSVKYPIASPVPPPSGFARLDAIEALPIRDKACVDLYRKWLEKRTPRAFAISLQGYCGWSSDNPIAADEAMMFCRQKSEDCRLYAFGDAVVWKPEDAAQDEGGH